MSEGTHIYRSFLIRVWLQQEPDGRWKWMGEIHHLQKGVIHSFHSLEELVEFMMRVLAQKVQEL
ncbi:MAG: hypothetical protein GXO55_07705 [Chloroflexi bacterium]|nr:hypothetical protein [Chloroflexota bacterium]